MVNHCLHVFLLALTILLQKITEKYGIRCNKAKHCFEKEIKSLMVSQYK